MYEKEIAQYHICAIIRVLEFFITDEMEDPVVQAICFEP